MAHGASRLWSTRCMRASGGELQERGAQRPADARLVTYGRYSPVAIGQLGDSGALDEGLGKLAVNAYRHVVAGSACFPRERVGEHVFGAGDLGDGPAWLVPGQIEARLCAQGSK